MPFVRAVRLSKCFGVLAVRGTAQLATSLETIDAIERYGVELPLVHLMYVAMGGSLDPTIREAGVIGPRQSRA